MWVQVPLGPPEIFSGTCCDFAIFVENYFGDFAVRGIIFCEQNGREFTILRPKIVSRASERLDVIVVRAAERDTVFSVAFAVDFDFFADVGSPIIVEGVRVGIVGSSETARTSVMVAWYDAAAPVDARAVDIPDATRRDYKCAIFFGDFAREFHFARGRAFHGENRDRNCDRDSDDDHARDDNQDEPFAAFYFRDLGFHGASVAFFREKRKGLRGALVSDDFDVILRFVEVDLAVAADAPAENLNFFADIRIFRERSLFDVVDVVTV